MSIVQPQTPERHLPAGIWLAVFAVLALMLSSAGYAWWRSERNDTNPPAAAATAMGTSTARSLLTTDDAFQRTWRRSDAPVASQTVARTWMWGPVSLGPDREEAYAESPCGVRLVRYYDKSRMEISDPNADQQTPWYVTNGLLVVELISGQLQTGNDQFEQRTPATQNVAGDAGPDNGPTYATMAALLNAPPLADGQPIIQQIDSNGVVSDNPAREGRGAVAGHRVTEPGIDHQIASPFWEFMQSSGPIDVDGVITEGPLFENPFYATGYPITEAYWTTVKVNRVLHDVLLQCFQRRCLTWTPDNQPGWQVESGNVGLHYYQWRYADDPAPAPSSTATSTATATATTPTTAPTATVSPTPADDMPQLVEIGPGAVDSWMRSLVRDGQDRLWLVAMNNNAATGGTGPGELRVYRATSPGVPSGFEYVSTLLTTATANGTIPFADAAIDGQNRLHVVWVDIGAAGQPLRYRVIDLSSASWTGPATTIDDTNLSAYGGYAAQGGVSLAVGFDGQPRVAYAVSGFQNHIRTKAYSASGWVATGDPLKADGAWVWHPSLALAPDGTWYLAAYDATNRAILSTRDSGSGWSAQQIVASDVLGPENIDQSPSLLITPAGIPTLTYLDGHSHLRVSTFDGSSWSDSRSVATTIRTPPASASSPMERWLLPATTKGHPQPRSTRSLAQATHGEIGTRSYRFGPTAPKSSVGPERSRHHRPTSSTWSSSTRTRTTTVHSTTRRSTTCRSPDHSENRGTAPARSHAGARSRDARLLGIRDAVLRRWGKMGADVERLCKT